MTTDRHQESWFRQAARGVGFVLGFACLVLAVGWLLAVVLVATVGPGG